MKRRRMAVARLWFEGNAFSPMPTGMAQFEQYEWRQGQEALEAMRGTATELGAVAAFAEAHPEWEVVVLRCAAALPSGPIDPEVIERYAADIEAGLRAGMDQGGWDAVYLSLHGAAIAAGRDTPELDIALMIRGLLPDVPLGASFDLHGNMPAEWAQVLDYASVYRTHPHVDMAETAERVLAGLLQCAAGQLQTRRVVLNEGVILPSINMRTVGGPMAELERAAREATVQDVLEVGVFGGFPYSDTPATGASVFVVSDAAGDPDGVQALAAARKVMQRVHDLADEFRATLPGPDEVVAQALAHAQPGLVAVTESSDNPLSGGGGDTPGLLRAMLQARPQVPCLFASFADPGIVQAARQAGVGGVLAVTLGGRHGAEFGQPVPARVVVERLTDGNFRNTGPMQRGVQRSCGGSVLLRFEGLPDARVIVTERVVAGDDPGFYALHGIDPAALRLLCVKAKNHFRAAFAPLCARIIDCDTPGPACLDLSLLPFRHRHIPAGG
ncbi:M81 family metallopeptidase [Bordetella sp. 2513F-2]